MAAVLGFQHSPPKSTGPTHGDTLLILLTQSDSVKGRTCCYREWVDGDWSQGHQQPSEFGSRRRESDLPTSFLESLNYLGLFYL